MQAPGPGGANSRCSCIHRRRCGCTTRSMARWKRSWWQTPRWGSASAALQLPGSDFGKCNLIMATGSKNNLRSVPDNLARRATAGCIHSGLSRLWVAPAFHARSGDRAAAFPPLGSDSAAAGTKTSVSKGSSLAVVEEDPSPVKGSFRGEDPSGQQAQ